MVEIAEAECPVLRRRTSNDALLEKLKSDPKEVAARGGELYVFADGDSAVEEEEGLHILRLPEHYGLLSPVLHVVPLQLLAYHVALVKALRIAQIATALRASQ